MTFDKIFGSVDLEGKSIVTREAARMVVHKNGKYLMLSTKRGDLIFPGGKAEDNETQKEASIRELREETGYRCLNDPEYIGRAIVKREDQFDKDGIFISIMNYFKCDVHEEPGDLILSNSELRARVQPIWASKKEIIERNRVYNENIEVKDVWVEMIEFIFSDLEEKVQCSQEKY